jgi:hypothetical protein
MDFVLFGFETEVYMLRQQPCGCFNASIPCGMTPSKIAPTVDENVIGPDGSLTQFALLQKDVWYNSSIMNTYDAQYLKFTVTPDVNIQCPIIVVDFQNEVGFLSAFISARFLPSAANYDFVHQFYGHSITTICPTLPNAYYGTYYVYLSNQGGRAANIYGMKFSVIESPTCASSPPAFDFTSLPSSGTYPQTWLEDGVMVKIDSDPLAPPPGSALYYKLYAEGRCSFFSAGLFKEGYNEGEPYLFASPTNPNPSPTNPQTIKWSSVLVPGDDWIDVHYCNPDPLATYNIFYIGVFVGAGRGGKHQLVATSKRYMPNIPLSSLAFSQYRQDLGLGAAPTLICETAVHQCSFFAFKGCDLADVGCCLFFSQVAPSEHVQAIWPWNAGDPSIGGAHSGIQWVDMQPSVKGKMAWSLLLEYSDPNMRKVITTVDPGKCNVSLAGMFVDSNGDMIPEQRISFQPKRVSCDYQRYQEVVAKMDELTASFRTVQDNVNSLMLQQVRLVIESWDDVYQACKDEALSYAQLTRRYTEDPAYICNKSPFDPSWASDACCNPARRPSTSCRPTLARRELSIDGTVTKTDMDTCSNPECSKTSLTTLIETSRHGQDETRGCQPAFSREASITLSKQLPLFTYECKIAIEGADLLGSVCASDSDCWYNATCTPTTKRCAHTAEDVIRCMSEKISFNTALNLFAIWEISERPSALALMDAFRSRWVKNICVGPRASNYRRGYHWDLIERYCRDDCLYAGDEPYCVDPADARTPTCPLKTYCDRAATTAPCYRYWKPTYDNPSLCASNQICNWKLNNTWPCEQGFHDTVQCQVACESGSASPDVCLDCSKAVYGTCLEVPWINDSSRCDQGLCTANDTVTDPTICSQLGSCTSNCPGCDQFACESTGTCSDYAEFKDLIDLGLDGVCLRPRLWLNTSYSCIHLPGYTLKSWGCANMNPSFTHTNCQALPPQTGARWYTFATDEPTCTTNAGYGCFSLTSNLFFTRNQSECAICEGIDCSWKPYYSWKVGQWMPGYIQSLVWQTRKYYTPSSVAPAVDYQTVNTDVQAAITRDFSYVYYTDSLCRYDSTNDLVKSVVCDCSTENNAEACFANQAATTIGSTRACPYQSKTLGTSVAVGTISETTVPINSGCHEVTIKATSVGKYQVPPDQSVTHALFKKIESNPYLIVVNDKKAVVGQLISDAATIEFDFIPETPITLCILTEDFIQIDSAATLYILAQLQSDLSIQVYNNSVQVSSSEAASVATSSNTTRLQVCGYVTSPGTFFAVAVVPNYRKLDPRPSAEVIAAVVLYSFLLAFAAIQVLLLIIDRSHQKLLAFKCSALFVIMVNCAVRIVYIIPPRNAFKKGSESIAFIIFELPTFLYFSVFTVIVYLWLIVVLNTQHFGKRAAVKQRTKTIRTVFILMNVFMYFIFVIFIYLIAILPNSTARSPCFLGNLDSAVTSVEKSIKIAYWIFQLIVAIILCVGFMVAAVLLLRIVRSLQKRDLGRKERASSRSRGGGHSSDVQMIIITVVAFVCAIFVLVRSCIFLDVAVNSTTLHVIVFCMLEMVPQIMLVFYLHPFQCFREAGRKSSSRSSSSKGWTKASKQTSNSRSVGATTKPDDDYEDEPSGDDNEVPMRTNNGRK